MVRRGGVRQAPACRSSFQRVTKVLLKSSTITAPHHDRLGTLCFVLLCSVLTSPHLLRLELSPILSHMAGSLTSWLKQNLL